MFRRNFSTKSASAIKSSEWRRTRDRLPQGLLPYLSTVAKVSAERIAFATDKATATLYWSVPDNQLVAMDPGNVLDDVPANTVLPSLVACWKAPGGIPTFCTPPQVMEKIFQAADLMAPGIFGDLPNVQPGQVVGVALLGNPRCVLAIGIALMDTHTIATQRKGKAVRIIHFYGDNLWEKCGKPKVPEIAPDSDDQPSANADNDQQPEPSSAAKPDAQTESGPSSTADPLADPLVPALDSLAVTDPSSDTDSADPAAAIDPDAATQLAFLYALLDLTALPPTDFANLLPISGSTFHSRFMQPHAKSIDMKTTKWKKLAKFLKAMEKEFGASPAGGARLLAVKELRGGEMQITAVNAAHAALKDAKACMDDEDRIAGGKPKKNEKEKLADKKEAAGDAAARVSVTPLLQPIAPLAFLFPGVPRDTYLTRSQVTQALDAYYTQHALTHPKDGRLVRVDDQLAKYAPKPPAPAPAPAPPAGRATRPAWEEEEERARAPPVHVAKRDAISAAVLAAMRKSYRVTDPRTGMDDVRRGEFRKVEISTEKRQGRKVVTVVKYLAQVMPVGGELQGELSAKCASSVSVGDMAGVPAAMGPVVQVQGDQVKFFRTWVAERGVAHLCEFVKK